MQVRELLRSVLKICQVIGPGEYIDNKPEESEALYALNNLINEWSARKIFLYNAIIETFNLQANKNEYSFGINGDFDSERPQFIKEAYLSNDNIDNALNIISEKQYFSIAMKNNLGLPTQLFYNNSYPLGTIYLYNSPNKNYKIIIASYKKLNNYSSVEEDVNLPPYYIRALKFNLALDIAPEYAQELIPSVILLATQSLNSLLIGNQAIVPESSFDQSITYY